MKKAKFENDYQYDWLKLDEKKTNSELDNKP